MFPHIHKSLLSCKIFGNDCEISEISYKSAKKLGISADFNACDTSQWLIQGSKNIGNESLLMAAQVQATAEVLGVEPGTQGTKGSMPA